MKVRNAGVSVGIALLTYIALVLPAALLWFVLILDSFSVDGCTDACDYEWMAHGILSYRVGTPILLMACSLAAFFLALRRRRGSIWWVLAGGTVVLVVLAIISSAVFHAGLHA